MRMTRGIRTTEYDDSSAMSVGVFPEPRRRMGFPSSSVSWLGPVLGAGVVEVGFITKVRPLRSLTHSIERYWLAA